MNGIALYLGVATIFAVAAFLASEWIRLPGAPAPERTGLLAIVAGLLWPVLTIGLAQWCLLAAVHRKARVQVVRSVRVPDDVRV